HRTWTRRDPGGPRLARHGRVPHLPPVLVAGGGVHVRLDDHGPLRTSGAPCHRRAARHRDLSFVLVRPGGPVKDIRSILYRTTGSPNFGPTVRRRATAVYESWGVGWPGQPAGRRIERK